VGGVLAAPERRGQPDGGRDQRRAEVRRVAFPRQRDGENSTLLDGNLVGEVTKLKAQRGKDISVSGSATLVRSLLSEGLLDELRLMVHPVVVGTGARLFDEAGGHTALELVDSATFSTGVLNLTYRPLEARG